MKLSPKDLYKFHVENLREVDRAMESVARSLRTAIAQGDKKITSSFTRLYALLLGAWFECRLQKLLYEPQGFDQSDQDAIKSEGSKQDQWKKAVEIAFRRQYKIPAAPLSADTLPHSAFSRYTTLLDILQNDLRSVIELRNKLAHGQWIYPLNNEGDAIAQDQIVALKKETLLSLQFKKKLLEALSAAIHDLVVSRSTFERDFDKHFRNIVGVQRNLRTRDGKKWVDSLHQKYGRGKAKKLSSPNP